MNYVSRVFDPADLWISIGGSGEAKPSRIHSQIFSEQG